MNRLLSKFALIGKMSSFCIDFLINFESICGHMVEKFIKKDANKEHFNNQMEFRKKSNIKNISKSFLLVFILFHLTSCNPCHLPKIKMKCCIQGRRPQVMATQSDCVWDYNQICPIEEYMEEESKRCRKCGNFECGRTKRECFNSCETSPCSENQCDKPCEDLSCGCNRQRPFSEDDFEPISKKSQYKIGAGDVLDISIFGDEETFVSGAVIPPDGKLYYTFIDGMDVKGKSLGEVRQEVAEEVKDLFLQPKVSIVPKVVANNSFKILGRVSDPGVYYLEGPTTIRDAIALAGGILKQDSNNQNENTPLESTADLFRSYLIRDGKKIKIDFNRLIYDGDNTDNIYVRPGDFIYIYPMGVRNIYILGAINGPQRLDYYRNMTLSNAMAAAGGFNLGYPYSPDLTKVLVIRGKLHCPCVMCVNFMELLNGQVRDVYLAPGDIVFVSNKQMRFGRELVRLAIQSFFSSFVSGFVSYYALTEWFPIPLGTDTEVDIID